jgi:hypothetical protein
MVDHICEPILSTPFASSELRRPPQDGGKTPLTLIKTMKRYGVMLSDDPPKSILIEFVTPPKPPDEEPPK